MGLLHNSFWLQLDLALSDHHLQLLNYFVLPRIADEGSLPEMRIWSILLIKWELKRCIHLSTSLFISLKESNYLGGHFIHMSYVRLANTSSHTLYT